MERKCPCVYWGISSSEKYVDSPDSWVKQTGVMRGGTNGLVILPEGGEILTSAVVPNINAWVYFYVITLGSHFLSARLSY